MPNSVHVDAEYSEDVFFDCGLTLFPGTRPYEEPGISACRDYTEGMRDAALSFFTGGTLVLGSGGAVLYLSRRRPSGTST